MNASSRGCRAGDDLFSAAQRGQVDRVKALLAAADTRNVTVQEEMLAALCIAIRNDFPGVVRILCTTGAHFGLAVQKYKITFRYPLRLSVAERGNFQPIHLAASTGSASCIDELVSRFQVSAGARDEDMDAPLHWACRYAHVDVVRQLLAVKASVLDENQQGMTPPHLANLYNHNRIVAALDV